MTTHHRQLGENESSRSVREWYRACTFRERQELLRDNDKEPLVWDRKRAEQSFQRWKQQQAFSNDKQALSQYLTAHDTDESHFLKLLGMPSEYRAYTQDSLPSWYQKLLEICMESQQSALKNVSIPTPGPMKKSKLPSLNCVIAPFITWALERIQEELRTLASLPHTPFVAHCPPLIDKLSSHLLSRLLPRIGRTFTLEMHIARTEGKLRGETPEARFQAFLERFRTANDTLEFLFLYPVLARDLVTMTQFWVESTCELFHRLSDDWKEIQRVFFPHIAPGSLVDIKMGSGDTHRKGRSVSILSFANGVHLVYKPRSVNIEIHFQDLLRFLNTHQDRIQFSTYAIISRCSYGWVEFIPHTSCNSLDQIQHFYERLGGYLALLYLLNATDFHFENLIASGEHPVLIDMESLFCPSWKHAETSQAQEVVLRPLQETIEHSVLSIGLLPQRIWSTRGRSGVDISGIGGKAGQISSQAYPVLTGVGTDNMRLQRQHVLISAQQNRPKLGEQDISASSYIEAIVYGFSHIYSMFLQLRHDLSSFLHTYFAKDEIRVILRATAIYSRIIDESTHPHLLRDGMIRERFYTHLWPGCAYRNTTCQTQMYAAECGDLHRGDIPFFTSIVSSRTLFTSEGKTIEHLLDQSGFECVEHRLHQLSMEDLQRQVWSIRASFAASNEVIGRTSWRHSHLVATSHQSTVGELIQAACEVGNRLEALAVRTPDAALWMGLSLVDNQHWQVAPTGSDLYAGLPGIILFLAYLSEVTGQQKYRDLAQVSCITLHALVEQSQELSLSAFHGLGSLAYLSSHLGSLWQDGTWWRNSAAYVSRIEAQIASDHTFDIIGGVAGTICCLLSLYQVAPSPQILTTALCCGEHLLRHASAMFPGVGWKTALSIKQPLTGFSHGAAGIAFSLARLTQVTGQARFSRTMQQALLYERNAYVESERNWPDLRPLEYRDDQTTKNGQSFMTTWCHGAPGIGLGRLGIARALGLDSTIENEIKQALQTTLERGFGFNHSLCHGDLGNVETLLLAREVLNDSLSQRAIERLSPMLLQSIEQRGYCSGVPFSVEVPGLMTGLAGIGYGLLRLATPNRVPSILLLDPPHQMVKE